MTLHTSFFTKKSTIYYIGVREDHSNYIITIYRRNKLYEEKKRKKEKEKIKDKRKNRKRELKKRNLYNKLYYIN